MQAMIDMERIVLVCQVGNFWTAHYDRPRTLYLLYEYLMYFNSHIRILL